MAAAANRIDLKQIDNLTKYLVFGYIRDIEQQLVHTSNDTLLARIPHSIVLLCLLYYVLRECFENCDKNVISLIDDKQTFVNVTGHGWTTTYGAIKIASLKKVRYEWKFKIIKRASANMAIGIDEAKYDSKSKCFVKHSQTIGYGIWFDGDTFSWKGHGIKNVFVELKYNTNDIVEMILDLNECTLQYAVNGNEPIIVFDNIETGENINYCMAICTGSQTSSVSLLRYSER